MITQTFHFPDLKKGDTFIGRQLTITNKTLNQPVDLTGYTISAKFRQSSRTGTEVKSITNSSGINLTDPTNGIFTIDSFKADWEPDIYYYDFEFTSPGGDIQTYFEGTILILQDVTYV